MQKRDNHPLEFVLPVVFLLSAYIVALGGLNPLVARPKTPHFLLAQSRAFIRTGKITKALKMTEELSRQFPTNHIYLDQNATIYHQLGRYSDEIKALQLFMKYSPLPDEACPRLGLAYAALNLNTQALEAHQECAKLAPRNPDMYFYLGLSFEHLLKFDVAEEHYQHCVSLSPEQSDCLVGLARINFYTNRNKEAIKFANLALQKVPGSVEALEIIRKSLIAQGVKIEEKTK
jgi:tetratricopeptide (TPR) repeat protein